MKFNLGEYIANLVWHANFNTQSLVYIVNKNINIKHTKVVYVQWESMCLSILNVFICLLIFTWPFIFIRSANHTWPINTHQFLFKRVWHRHLPVDELLKARSSLLNEGIFENTLISTEGQLSLQGFSWQRRDNNLQENDQSNYVLYYQKDTFSLVYSDKEWLTFRRRNNKWIRYSLTWCIR